MAGRSYIRFRLTNRASFHFGLEKAHQIRVSAKVKVDLAENPEQYDFSGILRFESLSMRKTRELAAILAEHISPEWSQVFDCHLKKPYILKVHEDSLYKRCLVEYLNPTGILFNSADEVPSIMGRVDLAIVDKNLERLHAPSWIRKILFRPTTVENLDDNALIACRVIVHLWKKGVDEEKPRIFQAERLPVQIGHDINDDLCWFACTVLGIRIQNFGCSYTIRIISIEGRPCRCIFVNWDHIRKAAIWYTSDENGKLGYCKVYSRVLEDLTPEMLSQNVIFDE